MATVEADLSAFLEDMRRTGWDWGQRDCLTWLGLWTLRRTGVDGAAPWRGRYRTALGCLRTLRKSGGMAACIERGALLAGLTPSTEAMVGAVALVPGQTPRGPGLAGAICTGPRWAILTAESVISMRATPTQTWTLPCPS